MGEVILPFVEGNRIKQAVRSRKDQMTPQEIEKNTEKHTLLFYNRKFKDVDSLLNVELNNFIYVEKLLLTKEVFYIQEKKSKETSSNQYLNSIQFNKSKAFT